jgi:hypothetical protein
VRGPGYLSRHGVFSSTRELAAHNCLSVMVDETVNSRWRFGKSDEAIKMTLRGHRVADDSEVMRR